MGFLYFPYASMFSLFQYTMKINLYMYISLGQSVFLWLHWEVPKKEMSSNLKLGALMCI